MTTVFVCGRCGAKRSYVNGCSPKPPLCDRTIEEEHEVEVTTPHYSYSVPSQKYIATEKRPVRCNGVMTLLVKSA